MVSITKIKTLLKPFYVIVFICLALFGFTACSKSKLDAPDTFLVNESILSWNSVENAEKYIVRINDVDEYETSEESFDISFISDGINKIQVKAKENDNYKQSDFGETLYINKLSAPTNIQLYGNKIRWSSVEGAESYSVKLYNSNYEVVFETISNSNNISFETIQSIIYSNPNYCILGISSNGKGQHSVLEDNTIIFATISSSFNTGYVINFENKMPKPDSIKLNKSNQKFEWTPNYINNKYNIEITDSDGKIIFKKENHNGASIAIEELTLETYAIKSDKYKIKITALRPEVPSWNLEGHVARFPELDSDVSELEFDIDLNEKISKPTNLMFYGETSYITSFTWNKPQGASKFILSLYDSTQTLIHSETLNSGGIYLATPYNKFIRKLTNSGTYTFTVKAIATEQNLFITNNKVVLYTIDSEIESFNFTYTSGTALSAPQNIQLSNKYINHKIQWKASAGVEGYEIEIEDENGDILYTGYADVQYDDGICYCYTERFISKLTSSGKYKISVVSLGSPNIGRTNILKSQDSNVSEFEFLYNLDTKEITNIT